MVHSATPPIANQEVAGASSETRSETISHTEEAFSTQPGATSTQPGATSTQPGTSSGITTQTVSYLRASNDNGEFAMYNYIAVFYTMHFSDNMTDFELLKCSFSNYTAQSIAVVYELCRYDRRDTERFFCDMSLDELLLKVNENTLTCEDSPTLRLHVDATPQDICESVIGFYKGPFEREAYLRIRVIGGSAVDLGGVRRQMLSVFFHEVAKGAFDLFEGPPCRLQPRVKPSNIASGLMKVFATAVGHSLVMDRVGFPFLSPAIYYYAVGCEEKAIGFVVDSDLSGQFRYVIDKV